MKQGKGEGGGGGRGWRPAQRPEGGAAAGGERLAHTPGRAEGGFWSSPRLSQSPAALKGLPQFSELRVCETQRHNKSRERRGKKYFRSQENNK